MATKLRDQVQRLASQNAALRPHLKALLEKTSDQHKKALIPLPRDQYSFGYEGVDAAVAASNLATEVESTVDHLLRHAHTSWRSLGSEILSNVEVDARPELSRTAVSEALRRTYLQLASKVEDYFTKLP